MIDEIVENLLQRSGFGNYVNGEEAEDIGKVLERFDLIPSLNIRNDARPSQIYKVHMIYSRIGKSLREMIDYMGWVNYEVPDSCWLTKLVVDDISLGILLHNEDKLYDYLDGLLNGKGGSYLFYANACSFNGRDLIDYSEKVKDVGFKRFLLEKAVKYLENSREREEEPMNDRYYKPKLGTFFCYRDLGRAYYGLFKIERGESLLDEAKHNVMKARTKAGIIHMRIYEETEKVLNAIEGA